VGTGFGNDSDRARYKQDGPFALTDRLFEMQVLCQDIHGNQGAKRPQENSWNVFASDVLPEMLVQEVIRDRANNKETGRGNDEDGHSNPIPGWGAHPAQDQSQNEDSENCRQDSPRWYALPPLLEDLLAGEALASRFVMDFH